MNPLEMLRSMLGDITRYDVYKFGTLILAISTFASVMNMHLPSDSEHQSITNSESFVNEISNDVSRQESAVVPAADPVVVVVVNDTTVSRDIRQSSSNNTTPLLKWGDEVWCHDSPFATPEYASICNPNTVINLLQLQGSTPSALRTIVLGGLLSMEQKRCFVVDDPVGLLSEYYAGVVGLDRHSDEVKLAIEQNRIHLVTPAEYWTPTRARRIDDGTRFSIWNFRNLSGTVLKKEAIYSILKLRPDKRKDACDQLKSYDFVNGEFVVLAPMHHRSEYDIEVRGAVPLHTLDTQDVDLDAFIEWAELSFTRFFDGRVVPVYVVTDECADVGILREKKPSWRIESACDAFAKDESFPPIELWNNADRNEKDRVDHLNKFVLDIYAAAVAPFYIGLGRNDFSWMSYFMRAGKANFILLDSEPVKGQNVFDFW